MQIPQTLLEKIEKDYMAFGCIDWKAFKLGYLAAIIRFGGYNSGEKSKSK